LSRGVADCALVAQIPALYWIEKNNWKNLTVENAVIISPDYCYAVLEENDDLLMLFSEGLAALKSTGEYREIYEKWLGVYEDSTPDIWETIKTILFIVIPLMVIVVFAILWTWILRRQVLKQTIEIKKNKDMLERITDTSPVGILVTNRAGEFTFVNSAAEKILGLLRAEIFKRTYNDPLWEITDIDFHHIADEDQPSFISYHKKEAVFDSPQWITRPDGIRKLLSVSTSPIKDKTGGVTAVVVVVADITKQYFSEAAIHKEKEQLSITLQSIGDGVVTTDNAGLILRMNRVAEEITGWTLSESAGKPFNSLCSLKHQVTGKQIEDMVSRVLNTGENEEKTNQLLLVSRGGIEKLVGISCALIKGSSEHILGAVLVIHDLTEGQKMQDYIQKTAKLDSLGILAGGIAHDFNNLLGGLFGYIEMAKQVSNDGEKVNYYLDESLVAFDRAKNLTLQLLTFSKGGNPIRKTDSLKNLIQHSSTFSLSGSKSSCTYHISEDLWLCDFDENQMGQVFDNLIINAQQAMPKGGEISISARNIHLMEEHFVSLPAGDYIQISLQDNGNGIEPDKIKQIFDPFYTTKEKGAGLGLATCYSIIKKHDGFIDVKSRLGVGTVFDIYLPKSISSLKAVAAERDFEVNHRGVGIIVIMDDEELIRTIVGKMVKSMGYDVIEAKNGKEVLQLCDKFHETGNPVIGALFDLTIPGGMGGKETVAICRKKFPDIPIFASSGYSSDPIMSDPEKYGFTASICKPYRFQELKTLFNTHLLQKK
jgi:PAS domain S-box-containing protein